MLLLSKALQGLPIWQNPHLFAKVYHTLQDLALDTPPLASLFWSYWVTFLIQKHSNYNWVLGTQCCPLPGMLCP